jgi:3-oxoacyl-[acyl-carrier protein] reductase
MTALRPSKSLSGKVALVTGATGGIGSAICKHLASEGSSVIVTYNSRETEAEQLKTSLEGSNHLVARAVVDDSITLTTLANTVKDQYGKLDILVNNAGLTRPVPHDDLDALDDELIDTIFRVNVRGSLAMVRAFKSLLLESEDSLVINISSIAARTGLGSNVAYCASKAALDSVTRSLARALAPRVRVVSVSPGWVMGEYAKRMPPEVIEMQKEKTPLGQLATPDDVAKAVVAVASHLTFSTGCIIPVDGGRELG